MYRTETTRSIELHVLQINFYGLYARYNNIMSARIYFIKRVKDGKGVYNVSARWIVKTDKFTLLKYTAIFLLYQVQHYPVKT